MAFGLSSSRERTAVSGQVRLMERAGASRPERTGHAVPARLAEPFGALYQLDETTAVEPLAPGLSWQREANPDTYPFGV